MIDWAANWFAMNYIAEGVRAVLPRVKVEALEAIDTDRARFTYGNAVVSVVYAEGVWMLGREKPWPAPTGCRDFTFSSDEALVTTLDLLLLRPCRWRATSSREQEGTSASGTAESPTES
jgi:hypothetical protein